MVLARPDAPSRAELAAINATREGLLVAGAEITLPDRNPYTVQPEDTLLSVALARHGGVADVLAAAEATPGSLLSSAALGRHRSWTDRYATIPPGQVGFRLTRQIPKHADAAPGSPESLAALYHLLGFRTEANEHFKPSPEGLPLAPTEVVEDAGPWRYQRRVPVAHLARERAGSKLSGPDPYAGTGGNVTLAFDYRDVYGNRVLRDGALPSLNLEVRDRDRLTAIHQWPASRWHYRLREPGFLEVAWEFDGSRYRAEPDELFTDLMERAAQDRCRLRVALHQLMQKGMTVCATVSLDPAQSIPLDTTSFIELLITVLSFVDSIGRANPRSLKDLEPPSRQSWTIPFSVLPEETWIPLRAQLIVERPAARVDEYFVGEPGVLRAVSDLSPYLEEPGEKGWKLFADDFEKALDGWKLARVAGLGEKMSLVALPFQSESLAVTPRQEPAFFAVPPLSTSAWSARGAKLNDYVAGQSFGDEANTVVRDIDGQDLEEWRRDVFGTVDRLLSPPFAPLLSRRAPELLERLLEAKSSLASAVAGRTAEVVTTPELSPDLDGPARRAAQAVMEQALRRQLGAGDDIDLIVQWPVDVTSSWSDEGTAPRLSLRPVCNEENDIQLTDAKVLLVDGEPGFLTTAVRGLRVFEGTSRVLELRAEITGLEIDVAAVKWADGYVSSRWLHFVSPAGHWALGRVEVPLPRRRLPTSPRVVGQNAVQNTPRPLRWGAIRKYRCTLNVDWDRDPHDQLVVGLDRGNAEPHAAATEASLEPLATALANWAYVKDRLWADVMAAFDAIEWSEGSPERLAIDALTTLVERVAQHYSDADEWANEDSTETTDGIEMHSHGDGFASRELDIIDTPRAWGYARVLRNQALLGGRATHPAFVLSSLSGYAPVALQPSFRHDTLIDVRSLLVPQDATVHTLEDRLTTFFRRLTSSLDETPSLDVQITASFLFPVSSGMTDIPVPVSFWFRRPFEPATDLSSGSGLCAELAGELRAWRAEHPQADPDGSWNLDVSLFLRGQESVLLHLTHVRVPLASVQA